MTNSTIARNLSLKGESSFRAFAELVRILDRAKSQHDIDTSGRRLLDLARVACRAGEEQICSDASKLVMQLPVSQGLHDAADYYRIILQDELVGARGVLVRVADSVPLEYRARVIHHIGYGYEIEGDFAEAARYYLEAAAVAINRDYLSHFHSLAGLAYLRSEDGDHAGAVADFEALFSMVSALSQFYPAVYGEHLNNFAVVLSRAGMTERAGKVIKVALASRFADRFPEWRETEREIEGAAQQEPRRRPAALTVVPIPAAGIRPREAPPSTAKKSRETFVIPVTDVHGRAFTPLPFRNGLPVVSPLERYVKTVRIRQP